MERRKSAWNMKSGIALAGAMLISFSCQRGEAPAGTGIPPRAQKLLFRSVPKTEAAFPFQYQADFRGNLPGDGEPGYLWFERRGNGRIRMDLLLAGKPRDSMTVKAPRKSGKEVRCTVGDMLERAGCTLKIESDADLFLVTLARDPEEKSELPLEFYINLKSGERIGFLP